MTTRRDFIKLTGAVAASEILTFSDEAQAQQPYVLEKSKNIIPYGASLRLDYCNTQLDFRTAILQYCQEVQFEGTQFMGHLKMHAREEFNTTVADLQTRFCLQNNLRIRGHVLIWGGSTPKWLQSMTSALELERFMNNYIEQTMTHFKNTVYEWNVVNEPYGYSAKHRTDFSDTVFPRLLGERYIDIAFKKAKQVNPQMKLILCEEGIYYVRDDLKSKRTSFEQLVFSLLDRGVPIDGIAIQGHLSGEFSLDIDGFQSTLDKFKKAGLSISITEHDVNDHVFLTNTSIRDACTAAMSYQFLKTVTDVVRPTSIHTWGISDKYTWLDFFGKRADKTGHRPLPLDEFYRPKLMMQVIQHFCKNGKA